MSQRTFYDNFPITSILALLVVGFYVLEVIANQKITGEFQLGVRGFDPEVFDAMGAMDPARIIRGEWWRVVSCVFLHGGLIHLFFNASVLFDLGRFCEPLLSSPKFFAIFVIAGISSSLLSFGNQFPDGPGSVGASGALCGLIGLMLVYSIRQRHVEMRDALLRWIVFIVVLGLIVPNIDHAGHLGGFLAGAGFGFTVKDYTTSSSASRWRYPAYGAGVVLAAGLSMAAWSLFDRLY